MNIKHIVLHHSAVSREKNNRQFDAINAYHRTRNFGTINYPIYPKKNSLGYYIQYHYMIEPNGEIKKCANENEVCWHASNWDINNSSLGICLPGNFDIEYCTEEQINALELLITHLKKNYSSAIVAGHRAFANKTCPGKLIDDIFINNFNTKKMWKTIKLKNDNRVYAVDQDGNLYWITSDRMYTAGLQEIFDKYTEVESINPMKIIGTFNKEY